MTMMMPKTYKSKYADTFTSLLTISLLVITAGMMTGCSSDNMNDLRTYIQSVKARPAGRIPPLPTFETYVNFQYSAAHLRDPFSPFVDETGVVHTSAANEIRPPITHKPEPLEEFPLDSMKFVGILERNNEIWGIISTPDKMVHKVKVGNYIGQNYGKITSISESKIELTETVSNGLGGWMERPAALSVVE